MSTMNTRAKLTVKETKSETGKYHYEVVDKHTGEVLSERKSNRVYVAATYDGNFFFGRVELAMKYQVKTGTTEIAYIE